MNAAVMTTRPRHVPEELVVDFDYREPPGHTIDVHLAWKRLHDGPDIVWTPRHGGHWIATRADDIDVMQMDHARFSYRYITIPPHARGTATRAARIRSARSTRRCERCCRRHSARPSCSASKATCGGCTRNCSTASCRDGTANSSTISPSACR